MITLIMRDKSITCTTTAPIYQYENNVEQIKCLLPHTYDGVDISNAIVTLVFKDDNGDGGFIELEKSDTAYSKDYLQFSNYINSSITQHIGKITIWLKINDYENDLSFETRETYFNITPSKEIPKTSETEQMSFFDQWEIKMNQTHNEILKVKKDVVDLMNVIRSKVGGDSFDN